MEPTELLPQEVHILDDALTRVARRCVDGLDEREKNSRRVWNHPGGDKYGTCAGVMGRV